MKKMIKKAVTLLFILSYGVLSAQINFFENFHDFGEIAEDGGEKWFEFRFRNTSTNPIVIVSARSSCGCTKAEYSRKPIMPDSIGSIKAIFNPMNYPGAFARKITIVTSEGVVEKPLLVTGVVIPRKKSLEEEYPIIMGGGVRATANALSFGYVEHGKVSQSTFDIVNTSKRRVKIEIENPYPELEFYYPEHIAPDERVAINFGCMLAENSTVYGSLSYTVQLIVDGEKGQYPFIINGLAIDSREENANNRSQMIAISEKSVKFGAVKCARAYIYKSLEVRNEGNRAITVRKIELESSGFKARLEGDSTIAPGEKREVVIELDPSRLPFGAVVERLRIVSNDPVMPVVTVRVTAIVEG